MSLINAGLLVRAVGCNMATAQRWAPPLSEACHLFQINTPRRLAAFLANTGHESLNFTRQVENLNYSADRIRQIGSASEPRSRWRSLVPRAADLARHPERLAEAAYGGRMGNGPEGSGDGWKYRGRGPMGTTGKANYEALNTALKNISGCPDFVLNPDALLDPKWGALAAAAYWNDHRLNELADVGAFDRITKRINGGLHGAADRRTRYAKARQELRA